MKVIGYFEDVWDAKTNKIIGTRRVENPDLSRGFGVVSERQITITEPLTIQKGHKDFTIKASAARPVVLKTYLQKLCGR